MKTIILGPPGTGKTTTLLNLVEEFLRSGTDIKNIGYFSFTKKAAWEATRRAEEKFMIDQKEIPYFRTLHSLAFRKLGLKKDQVMQPRHYKDLGKKLGFPVVLKTLKDNLHHKTEANGVFTDIKNLTELKIKYNDIIQNDKVAKVSIVGAGMVSTPGVTYRMFKALADEKINILAISTSEIKLSVIIDEENTLNAIKKLHTIFELD